MRPEKTDQDLQLHLPLLGSTAPFVLSLCSPSCLRMMTSGHAKWSDDAPSQALRHDCCNARPYENDKFLQTPRHWTHGLQTTTQIPRTLTKIQSVHCIQVYSGFLFTLTSGQELQECNTKQRLRSWEEKLEESFTVIPGTAAGTVRWRARTVAVPTWAGVACFGQSECT